MDLENKLNSLPKNSAKDLDIDSDDLKIQAKIKALEAERYSSDTKDRKWLAIWAVVVVSSWLIAVIIILVLNKSCEINLSDNVLITLLGTTTLNVLGLSFIVLKGHFNSTKS